MCIHVSYIDKWSSPFSRSKSDLISEPNGTPQPSCGTSEQLSCLKISWTLNFNHQTFHSPPPTTTRSTTTNKQNKRTKRRKKYSLRPMQLRNPLLQRMRPLHIPQSLHRNDMFPHDAHQREQTGIDGGMPQPSVLERLQHDGAGAAAALAAAELRALEAVLRADPVQQRVFRVGVVQAYGLAVEVEAEV